MTSKKPPTTLTTEKGGAAVTGRTSLVIYHRDGAHVEPLVHGRPVVVGRTLPSDVVIPDPGLSRQHARFSWDDHGLWVEDLESTNGTKKNGELVSRAKILPRDEIALGPVMVTVHVVSSIEAELRGFDGHDRFLGALDDEITRARAFQRPLALLMVRSESAHVSKWASRVRRHLRPVDRVGVYGPNTVLVSVPEATPELVRGFASAVSGGTPPLAATVVTFPEDGASVEELLTAVNAKRSGRAMAEHAEGGVVVKSAAMKEVMATVKRLAQSNIAVLILGETGTGKEVIARSLHEHSPRKKAPLRSINCAAIPATLIESMLFGHEHGAFTGADKQAKGVFEQADGGTVLLDEIGELAAPAQAALLRVLETKKLMRVGGDKEIAVDVRVIAATHRDLDAMVSAGRFREDLLYRLNTMVLRVPPLRERVDEIRPLAERFLKDVRHGTTVRSIDAEAMAALERYSWPGNVRELRNVIERAVVLATGKAIQLADLTDRVRGASVPDVPTGQPEAIAEVAEAGGDYREQVRRYETKLILDALRKCDGNQTEAAKLLGLPLRTLVHKIQTYGIRKKFER